MSCEYSFLGLRPWYSGLDMDSNCVVIVNEGTDIPTLVWKVVLNISVDLFVIAGLVALGFLIWGGFKYIMSNGEPGLVTTAKKTISSAIIGLVISVMASVIVNTVINLLEAAK